MITGFSVASSQPGIWSEMVMLKFASHDFELMQVITTYNRTQTQDTACVRSTVPAFVLEY